MSIWRAKYYTGVIDPANSNGFLKGLFRRSTGNELQVIQMASAADATAAVVGIDTPSKTIGIIPIMQKYCNQSFTATTIEGQSAYISSPTTPPDGSTPWIVQNFYVVAVQNFVLMESLPEPYGLNTISDAIRHVLCPVVSLTSPMDGAMYTAPANITISANASDPNGTVSSVDFYNGSTLLNSDNTSPYSYAWNNVGAGTYTIYAKAYDNDPHNSPTAQATVTVTNAAGTGLRGQYYDNSDLTSLKLTRTDASVNFNWTTGSPDASVGADTFSVRWTGMVKAPYTGTITFYSTCDDGERLWVNGQPLITDWASGTTERSGTVALTAGQFYKIELEMYEDTSSASAVLSWSYTGQSKVVIPTANLYPPTAFDLAPSATMTAPTSSAQCTPGGNYTLTATATDAEGTITKIEFYNSTTKLGEDTNGDDGWSYTWNSIAQGQYAVSCTA